MTASAFPHGTRCGGSLQDPHRPDRQRHPVPPAAPLRRRTRPPNSPPKCSRCAVANDIEHRFTKISHPWTNGQVERMNRTIKEATVQRFPLTATGSRPASRQLRHAYNFGRRLKTLKGLTPYEFVCKAWTSQPEQFTLNPLINAGTEQLVGPNGGSGLPTCPLRRCPA